MTVEDAAWYVSRKENRAGGRRTQKTVAPCKVEQSHLLAARRLAPSFRCSDTRLGVLAYIEIPLHATKNTFVVAGENDDLE